MMQRSGGFNVPADYFKPGGKMPAPVPAMPVGIPRTRSRWPLWAGMAGIATAVGIVIAIFAKSSPSPAAPEPAPIAAPAPTKTAAAGPAPVVKPALKQVVLAVQPIDAHVFEGDQDLGESPVVLELEPDAKRTFEIRREGYHSKTVEIDASEARRSVSLDAIATRRGGRPSAGRPSGTSQEKPKPKGTLGGGDIVNPWGE
jgi:serine/threonine-protein kinase